jgi:hypothetical protein
LARKRHRKHKHRKPKLQRNHFGCVAVGGTCLGDNANCCSGICEGKKPKKGKKDTSVCAAHDTAGTCSSDTDTCTIGQSVNCADNPSCICLLTTGNAGFCGDASGGRGSQCRNCIRDTDCQQEFGPGAACIVFGGTCSDACPDTGHRLCYSPCPNAAL